MELTAETARALFEYNPETGHLTYRVTKGRRVVQGRRAGCQIRKGYRGVRVEGNMYQEHRLIWLVHFGHWPTDQLDHINGRRSDNRLCNLRECTSAENNQNRKASCTNELGLLGVRKSGKRFFAKIKHNYRDYYLGTFDTPEEAHAAYAGAKAVLHTFNPRVPARSIQTSNHC